MVRENSHDNKKDGVSNAHIRAVRVQDEADRAKGFQTKMLNLGAKGRRERKGSLAGQPLSLSAKSRSTRKALWGQVGVTYWGGKTGRSCLEMEGGVAEVARGAAVCGVLGNRMKNTPKP